jgi:hypothetical protein
MNEHPRTYHFRISPISRCPPSSTSDLPETGRATGFFSASVAWRRAWSRLLVVSFCSEISYLEFVICFLLIGLEGSVDSDECADRPISSLGRVASPPLQATSHALLTAWQTYVEPLSASPIQSSGSKCASFNVVKPTSGCVPNCPA